MHISGPDWPCTRLLQEALATHPGPDFKWGQGGKNGLQQLQAFQANGIPCPEFTTSLETAKVWVRSGIPVFGRKLHHTQGRDIVDAQYTRTPETPGTPPRTELRWITTRKGNRVKRLRTIPGSPRTMVGESWNPKWVDRDFWVKVLPSVAEYRQHIFGDKAIRRGRKIQVETPHFPLLVRSRRNGYHIDYGPFESPQGMKELCKKAVACLGYTHGACDVLQDAEGKLYILEVNSAPAVGDTNTLNAYVSAIKQWAQNTT